MSLGILAEALARIEHKVDLALASLSFLNSGTPYPKLGFIGTPCPVCMQVVDYQIDINNQVVIRRCGCKTGKFPPLIPIYPVTGAPNGNTPASSSTYDSAQSGLTEDRAGRKEG